MTAEGGASRAQTFSRDWAGLTQQGRILISIERIINGDPLRQILAHETAHDVLIKSTQLGWSQLALSAEAFDPAPEGELRRRCGHLLDLSVTASKFTQEGVATFLPSLGLDATALAAYRARHPQDYLDAAGALEWLRARPIPGEAKQQLVFAAGTLALAVFDLAEWRRERLHEAASAERWFSLPVHRPDRRFPALCRALESLRDRDLAAAAGGGVNAVRKACRGVAVDGRGLSFAGIMAASPSLDWMKELAASVFGPFARDSSLADWEKRQLAERWEQPPLSLPGLTPTLMSVCLTFTTSTSGRIDVNPPIAELHGYPLVMVLHNAFTEPVPGVEPVRGAPLILKPGDSALWFVRPDGSGRACHLSPGWFRDWLDTTGDGVTLCVRDGAYFFGVPIGEPRLKRRRHVVLIQHRTPQQLVLELPIVGLDEQRGPVYLTIFDSDYEEVAYLLLRPESGSPVVIVPTARVTADRCREALLRAAGSVKFVAVQPPEFLTSGEMLKDVIRVLSYFEGKPWPPEVLRSGEGEAPAAAPGLADELEPLMAEASRTWEAYVAEPAPAALAAFAAAAERVLGSRELQTAPLARRADVLESIAGSFLTAGQQRKDEALVRRSVVLSEDLLSLLPADWPGRFQQVRLAGYARLALFAITGEDGARSEALRLLRESHTPGF